MQHALPRSVWLTVCGIVLILAGCDRMKSGGGRETGAITAEKTGDAARGKIPVTTGTQEARALYDEGLVLFDQLRFYDAREKFQQAVARDPEFAMAHYQLALSSPSNKESLEHLEKAVAASGKASEGERLAILGLQASFNSDRAQALKYAQEAVEKYPEDERARSGLANLYSARQENEKAVDELKKAIELNPAFSPAYNSLGYAYRPLNMNDEAEAAFKKYIELVPNDPNPYDSYAELLMKTGRFDESIAQYRKALSIDPHFTSSGFGIASNLMFQGKHDQAITEAQKIIDGARNDGDRRFGLFIRSLIYADQGKNDLAVRELEKEYALDAKAGDSSQMASDADAIGTILVHTGKPEQAQKRFQQALDLQLKGDFSVEAKDDAKLAHHYYLGRVALARNDLGTAKSEAAEYLKGAEAKQNDLRARQAHELAGTIALKEKDFDKAISELRQANQQDPYVLYVTALAHQGKGDDQKAQEMFRQAAESYSLPTLNYVLIRAKAKKQTT
jgi:tetratricopeptide (TPR) repeat protein